MNDDLISREALKEKAETVTLWNGDVRRFVSYETIDNAPTVHDTINLYPSGEVIVQETRPKGEWIHYLGCGIGKAVCSECGQAGETKKYCTNCGADMRGNK